MGKQEKKITKVVLCLLPHQTIMSSKPRVDKRKRRIITSWKSLAIAVIRKVIMQKTISSQKTSRSLGNLHVNN